MTTPTDFISETVEERYERVHNTPSNDVQEYYTQFLYSMNVHRSRPNNFMFRYMIRRCKNRPDVELLFDLLHKLYSFTQSYLDSDLCKEVAYTCSRVKDARVFGLMTMWEHNEYGLVPSVECANTILVRASSTQDVELMVAIMELLERNDLPLQSDTADILCSICYDANNWELLSMYLARFVDAGVELQETTFDMWMEFAAKIGDDESLLKIKKLRSESMKQHPLASAVSCAKGFVLRLYLKLRTWVSELNCRN